jgi:hypothetical protein
MTSPEVNHSTLNRNLLQFAFVLWLLVVNFFYYLQFKALLISRFAALKHR